MLRLLRTAALLNSYTPKQSTIEWTIDDRKHLTTFLATGTGRKLDAIANLHVAQVAISAVSAKERPEYNCGIAKGVHIAWGYIESLKFRSLDAQDSTQEDDSGIPEELKQ